MERLHGAEAAQAAASSERDVEAGRAAQLARRLAARDAETRGRPGPPRSRPPGGAFRCCAAAD